jgi:hypothetical protein
MFDKFPREIGSSRKIVHNKDDMINWINRSNGYKNCFTSVYKFNEIKKTERGQKADYYSAEIDKIFFDFDIEPDNPDRSDAYDDRETALNALNRFHEYLDNRNIKHAMFISGGGFHGYIFCGYNVLEYKKQALQNAHMHFIDTLDLKIDNKIPGDIARITRIPNTYNLKREKFCVPILPEEIKEYDADELFELAKSPRLDVDPVVGEKKLFLENFDHNKVKSQYQTNGNEIEDIVEKEINIEGGHYDLEKLNPPESIRYILNKDGKLDYRDRYILIMFMRENGLSEDDCVQMMKEILSDQKFYHCTQEECGHLRNGQITYLYSRNDLHFPTEETIRDKYGYPISGKSSKEEKVYQNLSE